MEAHPAKPGTDERYLLDACLQAKYRVLVVQSGVPRAGLHCRDVLHGEELFLMDLGLSQTAKNAAAAFAARTIPVEGYWMTCGAGLPINSKAAVQDALRRIERRIQKLAAGPGSVPLLIVRTCLAAGAAEYAVYESAETKSGAAHRRHRWRWS